LSTCLHTYTAGALTAKPQVVPVYVDVDVEIAEALLPSPSDQRTSNVDHRARNVDRGNNQRSNNTDQWAALQDMYARSICPADIAAIAGYEGKVCTCAIQP